MDNVYFHYDGVRYFDYLDAESQSNGLENEDIGEIINYRRLCPNRHQRRHLTAIWSIAKKYHLDGVVVYTIKPGVWEYIDITKRGIHYVGL